MAYYVSKEKEYFNKVAEIVLNVIPKNLRVKFKERWKDVSKSVWNDDGPSGQSFLQNLTSKPPKFVENSIKSGNTAKWDGTALFFAFRALKHGGHQEDINVEKALDELREIRNESFAHLPDNTIDKTDYQTILCKVKQAFTSLGWKDDEICYIDESVLQNDNCLDLKEKLVAEKQQNDKLMQWLADHEERITDNKQIINRLEERTKKLEEANEQKAEEEQTERLFKVPPEVDNFVGRDDVIQKLKKGLSEHPMVILHALPGCGKTALVIRLAHQLKDPFDNVIMVDARDVIISSAKISEFDKLCTRLLSKLEFDLTNVATDTDMLSLVEGVLKNMKRQKKKTLFILDNSEEIVPSFDKRETKEYKVNSVNRLLSAVTENAASCFQILCVSRYAFDTNLFQNASNFELEPLNDEESCQVLQFSDINDEDTRLLIEKSRGFPLLLQLISKTLSTYMETNDKDHLLQKFRDLPLSIVSENIKYFLEAIMESLSEQEKKLMEILCIFPSSFSRCFVDELCKKLRIEEIPFEGIDAKGFLTRGSASGFSLHPLLRECLRRRENNADVEHALLRVYVKCFLDISERSFEKDQSPKCVEEFNKKMPAFEHLLSMTNQDVKLKVEDPLSYVLLMRFLYDLVPKKEIQTLFGFFEKQADESNLDIIKACIEETTTDFKEVEGEAPKNEYADMIFNMRKLYYLLHRKEKLIPALEEFVSMLEKKITVLKDGGTSSLHKKVMAYYDLKFLKLKGKFYGMKKKDEKKQTDLLHQSLQIAVENFGISFVTLHCYERLAVNSKVSNDREAAKRFFDEAYEIAKKANFIGQAKLANLYFLLTRFLLKSKNEEEILKGEEFWWKSFDLIQNIPFVPLRSDFWEEGRKIFFKSFEKIFSMHKDNYVEKDIREKAEDLINKFTEFYAQIEMVKVKLSAELWRDCYQLHRDIATRTAHIILESERKSFAKKAKDIKEAKGEERIRVEKKDLFFLNKIIQSKRNYSEQQLLMQVTFLNQITDAIVKKGSPEEVGQHVEKIQSLLEKMSVGIEEIKSDYFRKGGWVRMKLVYAILVCSSNIKPPTPLLLHEKILAYFKEMVEFTEIMASKPDDLPTEQPYFVTKDLIEGKAKLFENPPVEFWDLCKRIKDVFEKKGCKSKKSEEKLKKAFSKVK